MIDDKNLDGILTNRRDLQKIMEIVTEGATVLDLGCGAGSFLKLLKNRKNARILGVEIDPEKLAVCVERGVPVVQANFDYDLAMFPDKKYDFVMLSRTLQTVRRPDLVLNEMMRVAKTGIVSFMNFGHINSRFPIIFGNMPVNKNLPLPWYNTPTIHPGTIADLRNLFRTLNIKVVREIPLSNEGDFLPALRNFWPNLFASNCIFVIEK